MPNKPAAAKWLRQSKKRAAWNAARKDAFKSAIKRALKATNKDEVVKLVREAQQALDKAAKRGVIKKNTAARKLSRLMGKAKVMTK